MQKYFPNVDELNYIGNINIRNLRTWQQKTNNKKDFQLKANHPLTNSEQTAKKSLP